MPFWEKYNQLQTIVPGEQSVLYPGAPQGLVVPGDPGIPRTISPSKGHNFAPRIGLAYAPISTMEFWKAFLADSGKSSIRASYGMFYTAFPGLSAGIMYAVPPFGYNYLSPAPPLFATPFINAEDGGQNINPFPLTFPPHNVSAQESRHFVRLGKRPSHQPPTLIFITATPFPTPKTTCSRFSGRSRPASC